MHRSLFSETPLFAAGRALLTWQIWAPSVLKWRTVTSYWVKINMFLDTSLPKLNYIKWSFAWVRHGPKLSKGLRIRHLGSWEGNKISTAVRKEWTQRWHCATLRFCTTAYKYTFFIKTIEISETWFIRGTLMAAWTQKEAHKPHSWENWCYC